jgi:hypothetical protein
MALPIRCYTQGRQRLEQLDTIQEKTVHGLMQLLSALQNELSCHGGYWKHLVDL